MPSPEPNLARPFAPHRLRIYLGAVVFMSAVMAITTTGTALGVLPANMTLDVVGNIALALPLVTIPFVVFWDAPGRTDPGSRPLPNSPWCICHSRHSAS